jgi:hypothetical protein
MNPHNGGNAGRLSRRAFLQAIGGTAGALSFGSGVLLAGQTSPTTTPKSVPTVRGAFVYPPTEVLKKAGYYSWPGSTFDAEGRQKQYTAQIKQIGQRLGMGISMDEKPLDGDQSVARFIAEVKDAKPDGLLLIPFKKSHFEPVVQIIEQTKLPTVVLVTLGVVLVEHVRRVHHKAGVFAVSSLDNLDAVEDGLRMICTARRMRESLIVNIRSDKTPEITVPHIGTTVRTIPRTRLVEAVKQIGDTQQVKQLADSYLKNAQKVYQPTASDVHEAAKTYFALKRIVEDEKADAIMMECLSGLAEPHAHVPPCMGFMSLRDEGIPAGCESDLDATLTMMLLQQLFDRPGFQHNPSVDTEKNHYFCAHCTSASKMKGPDAPAEPYVLMNHAEAGWGCVPRVLFTPGQAVTIAKYLSTSSAEARPQMLVYSGSIVGCPPVPQAGGCRTNAEIALNELEDVCELKGHHLCMIYGNYAKRLRAFCQLYGIDAIV